MEKIIDFSKSVSDICKEYPEVMDIMRELGFENLSPAMLATVGRFMTIPKGAQMKKLDLETIKEEFRRRGYEVKE
ncbi:MAG TPA: DUF1858 domain-containing protein [Bacillota bacterium]|jgi:hypothetical protein|nr:hypothetical protein [Clostridiales bacterium UBA9856]HOA42769.1 DUF1858 domain-containing protein [Bacillota bacterium]HPZ59709.1 DUF1858 domain-containing protein [Bacillota bacterium]HQC82138.1 DUF1858 domain-containing protein [Bacillota bacterium]